MIAPTLLRTDRCLQLSEFILVWEMGTGLPVTLSPGRYHVTGEDCIDGITYFRIDNAYRVPADKISPYMDVTTQRLNEPHPLEFRLHKGDAIALNYQQQ